MLLTLKTRRINISRGVYSCMPFVARFLPFGGGVGASNSNSFKRFANCSGQSSVYSQLVRGYA